MLVAHPLIRHPNAKEKENFKPSLPKSSQARLGQSVSSTLAMPVSTRKRLRVVWWGGTAWARVEMVLKLVLLLSRNTWERNRTKPQLQTGWTHCLAEFESFDSAGRIPNTWSEGVLWALPGKGPLTSFREMLIHNTPLSHPKPLLIVVESLGNFPDFEDDFSFHFLLKLGMWCRCCVWLKSMSSLFCAVVKYNWSWWHQSPGRQLKTGKW